MNLNAALNSFFFQALSTIHTCMPATIVEYDPATRIAKVKPSVNHILDNGIEFEFPDIASVPVIFPCSKKFTIDFPLNPGDGLLLVVCEGDLGEWKEGLDEGTAASPSNTLRFQLSNCVAIPGLMSKYEEPTCHMKVDDDGNITFTAEKVVFDAPAVFKKEVTNESVTTFKDEVTAEAASTFKGKMTAEGDTFVHGNLVAETDVLIGTPGAVGMSVLTHFHPSAMGPTGPSSPMTPVPPEV